MVQLVFVHGVATRSGPGHAQQEKNRDELFASVAFDGVPLKITAPMWGDLVPKLAWNGAAFPKNGGSVESFAIFGGLGASPGGAVSTNGDVLVQMAKTDAPAAIDELFARLVTKAEVEGRDLTPEELSQFKKAAALLESSGFKPQIAQAQTDEQFVEQLRKAIGEDASFGILDTLKDAAVAVADEARNLVSTGLSSLFRDDLNPLVAQFLGDIFVYLKPGKVRDDIRARIAAAIGTAFTAARATGEPIVLMGHSLGGVILYDMLSSPAAAGLPGGFRANVLVTVGSQPGVFQEMGLFDFKPPNQTPPAPPAPIAGPLDNVDHWINVFDAIDLLGFRAAPIFGKATDFEFNSRTGLLSSHTTYFKRPQFHARLRQRLKDARVIS
jgi:hypothetical protein